MKKILSVILSALLALPFGFGASAADAGEKTGTLKFIAYNVSGIPLVGNFQGTVYTTTKERARLIGKLLNGGLTPDTIRELFENADDSLIRGILEDADETLLAKLLTGGTIEELIGNIRQGLADPTLLLQLIRNADKALLDKLFESAGLTPVWDLLNETDADLIGTEEDFNGADALAAEMVNYPYRTYTSGGLAQGQGLNLYSRYRIYNVERVRWRTEYGALSGSMDALSNKGFVYALVELAEGVYLNVINVHMDAGYDPLSIQARADNFRQLAEYINGNLNDGRALIVQGDFNFKFKRRLDDDLYGNLLKPTGMKDVWAELNGGVYDADSPDFNAGAEGDDLDRVIYRSGEYMLLTPVAKTVPPLTGENGERYTDHNPMLTEFEYTLTGSEPTPETLVEPTAENPVILTLKEIMWTFLRIFQAVLGLFELPYLAYQGVDMLINGKMP